MKMACQIFKQLTFRTNTYLKRASNLFYCHDSVSLSTQNASRKSLLTHKLPALTLAALMTIKLPPVLSTVHNTEFCSSYSSSCGSGANDPTDPQRTSSPAQDMENSPSQDPKQTLSPMQYHVTQEAGTERAFTGKYYDHWEPGVYTCVVCGADLFGSETKYNSGSGWPSFHSPYSTPAADPSGGRHNVVTVRDKSHGMVRDEVRCKKCGSHLGHVFDDGPLPSGLRYCINSAALDFRDKEQ